MNGPTFPGFPVGTDAIRYWALLAPDRIALVDRAQGHRVSYAEFDGMVARWVGTLRSHGVERDDRVAVLAENSASQAALLYACMRLGAALVPLNWRLSARELAAILDDALPVVLVVSDRHRALGEDAHARRTNRSGNEVQLDLARDVVDADEDQEPVIAGADDAALVLYTSGSTGRPKGVVLPHRQLFYNALATTIGWELGATDVAPISTPFFHTGGWNVFAIPLWSRGGRVVLFDRFDPSEYLDGLAEEGCTVAMAVPTQYLMMRDSARWGLELPSLRFFISGGAPCPPALASEIRARGYRFREGYGLTECGPNCFATTDENALAEPGSVGWPAPFLETRIVDESDADTPDGEPGELILRGPQMFGGYLHDPDRTSEALAPGGWLRTGDIAVRDTRGIHRICGRRKEMYISGGENVFPAEVESVLADLEGVAEVVVVGVEDALWGEVGRAFVVPRPRAALDPERVTAFARSRLAGYKVPRQVVIVDSLPRLGSGKPDRRALTLESSLA